MQARLQKVALVLAAPLISLAVAYLAFAYWQQLAKAQALQAELAQVRQNIFRQEQEVQELKLRLRFYQSPRYLDYVEFVAREALGMARPGDTVIIVTSPPNTPR